jgi:hypothetical protein
MVDCCSPLTFFWFNAKGKNAIDIEAAAVRIWQAISLGLSDGKIPRVFPDSSGMSIEYKLI